MTFQETVLTCVISLIVGCFTSCTCCNYGSGHDIASESMSPKIETIDSCLINIYVENSGSMYGYVNGQTAFKNNLYDYITDLRNTELCKDINFYYINSDVIKQDESDFNFIKNLTVSSFNNAGGSHATTDIADVIGKVLALTDTNTISIMVSDFVYSPGKQQINSLPSPSTTIRGLFNENLKRYPELSVIFYRFSSEFKGRYYDYLDDPVTIDQQRPYYMMILGGASYLRRLKELMPDIGYNVLNRYELSNAGGKVNYIWNPNNSIGLFGKCENPREMTGKAKIDPKSKKFTIAINVDFSDLLLSDEYIMNPDNYRISNRQYDLRIKDNNSGAYSHTLYLDLKGTIISKGDVKIELLKKECDWAEAFNENDDTNYVSEDKTYGLEYLVDGIYGAYETDNYATITITIR